MGRIEQYLAKIRVVRRMAAGSGIRCRAATVVASLKFLARDGGRLAITLTGRETSWLPAILGAADDHSTACLADVCTRISCGVATGADAVFVVRSDSLDPELRPFSRPTLAGRQLSPTGPLAESHRLLLPYSDEGTLIHEEELGALGRYLNERSRRQQLLGRTCTVRKPWYAFHETPPMAEVLKPKLLCKDITASPFFVPDRSRRIVPRHSVYYIVPSDSTRLDGLADYLASPMAQTWLRANCQRAANGFLRLQSHVLKRLPVPQEFLSAHPPASTAGCERAVGST